MHHPYSNKEIKLTSSPLMRDAARRNRRHWRIGDDWARLSRELLPTRAPPSFLPWKTVSSMTEGSVMP